ncbi:MAG: H-NS histone family protein [Rhodocyclaceae bacterium]|nr:H-NS histone family protein [Rhodocyclaceae bacterium]
MATYKELLSQIEHLKNAAEEARQAEVAAGIAEIRQRMAELGITVDDLSGGKRMLRRRVAAPSGVVKYRNPQTGQTWSGKGRTPGWIREADDRNAFLVG